MTDRNLQYPIRACRSCGAPLIFASTGSGKTIPVDATPQKRVVLRVTDLPNGPPIAEVVDTYVSHFVTCPNAAQHRKPKEGGKPR